MKRVILLSIISVFIMFISCKEEKILTNVEYSIDKLTVTATEASIEGTYSANAEVQKVIILYSEDSDMNEYGSKNVSISDNSFSVTISELKPGTKYYYYFRFSDENNQVNTDTESFTTNNNNDNDNDAVKPTVTTKSVSNISQVSASCGGNVTNNGGAEVTKRGVCWSTSQNPTTSNSHTTDGSGNGEFTSSITGLSANTKYYVRAYATNSAGTSYGEEKSFYTSQNQNEPTVTTKNITNITETTASCGGNVTNDGGAEVTERGVCWSISQNPTVDNNHVSSGSGNGEFSCSMTDLSPNTTYYVRAYAKNSLGIGYGEEKSFKTSSGAWIKYDNGSIDDAIGLSNGGSIYWCSLYPSSMIQQYSGMKLTKVGLGVFNETHTGNFKIFIGDEQVHSQSYNANNANTIMEFELTTPVTISGSKDLTIMFTNNTGQYVAAYSEITSGNGGSEGSTTLFDFEDNMDGWVTVDADGDGYGWYHNVDYGLTGDGAEGNNGSTGFVFSQSYVNDFGPLNPDNYLATAQKYAITAGSKISFWACGQDESYAAEHFGVAVSTSGNTSGSNFTTISEWTISAKNDRQGERSSRQSTWKKYEADLSAYAGQEVYIAIRHFNCTDQYFLDIDDIEITICGEGANGRWISTDGVNWTDVIESVDDVSSWIIRGYVTDSAKGEIMLTPQRFEKNPNAVGGGTLSKSK